MKTNNTSILRGAWAITKPGMRSLIDGMAAAELNISFEDFFSPRQSLSIVDGIAMIDVKGSLLDNAPPIFEKLGSTDYRTIRSEIAEAEASGAKGIMFMIDSPGGTVAGLAEASDAIQSATIPTAAFCDGMACSAAYHLASSAQGIAATPSADVGNIGTVLHWYDDSKMLESFGIESIVITNDGADLKGTFRDSPMTDGQREFLQAEVNQMGEEFQNHVTESRTVDAEVFRAGWYHGDKAESLGLIDAVSTFDQALDQFKASIG